MSAATATPPAAKNGNKAKSSPPSVAKNDDIPAVNTNEPVASTAALNNASASGTTTMTATSPKKKQNKPLVMGVPDSLKPTVNKLDELAEKLGCRVSVLVWEGVNRVLADPPAITALQKIHKAAPINAASGFWVVPIKDDATGRFVGAKVVEVAKRNDITDGNPFHSYNLARDPNTRDRARRQAIASAQYALTMMGSNSKPTVIELNPIPQPPAKTPDNATTTTSDSGAQTAAA